MSSSQNSRQYFDLKVSSLLMSPKSVFRSFKFERKSPYIHTVRSQSGQRINENALRLMSLSFWVCKQPEFEK